eukprot:Tbor_TRINITY_DN5469_c0_g1::TRINITY_DN5469_c0_g1_i4::g.25308::m.25308
MEIFRVALLLLLQLSPTFVHINGEVVPEYMCDTKQTGDVTVKGATAKLTKGCVVDATEGAFRIKFDLDAMYKAAASKTTNYSLCTSGVGAFPSPFTLPVPLLLL